ncbi:hypothetical protein AB0J40_24575 [Amycolatopsis sp. NPDC049691]|uniref:hypothetical protein n=1 Tax=Amycolatopsis sp. NPDC049691 TaxID=3155155 RepID=UPI00342F2FD4
MTAAEVGGRLLAGQLGAGPVAGRGRVVVGSPGEVRVDDWLLAGRLGAGPTAKLAGGVP